jgi:RNA polymerase sigma-70 factor (ECF subfamily)
VSIAVESAYRAHGEALFRYLIRLSGRRDQAEDLLQDTFQTLMERPPPDTSNLRGWLFRVATNRFRDLRRRHSRRGHALAGVGPELVHSDPPPSPERHTQTRFAAGQARRLLEALDERDRVILLMREEGFTHREIADAVDTTTGSVGTMIARALNRAARVAEAMEMKR